ncbi:Papain family cysteine protease [Perilla frutescens var. frutescens]|nr:Papain family cysteine protease [Perilla frutescens var. frutescens]
MSPAARLAFLGFLLFVVAAAMSFQFSAAAADADVHIFQGVDDSKLFAADEQFISFQRKYGKVYATQEEHDYRFSVFKANLNRVRRHQLLDPNAFHGVTKFFDFTPREFRRQFLADVKRRPSDANMAPILPTDNLPNNFDWRDHGAVTPVKDQSSSCGSSWAFSTTGALEGANFAATGRFANLSQPLDCDHESHQQQKDSYDSGCSVGLMNSSFDFSLVSVDEGQIAANLVKNGPLAVGMNADFLQTYVRGISCPYICSKRHLNHGALLVGYGRQASYYPNQLKETAYWMMKNSWGENWGENGYYRICRDNIYRNVCGVNSMVSTVTTPH